MILDTGEVNTKPHSRINSLNGHRKPWCSDITTSLQCHTHVRIQRWMDLKWMKISYNWGNIWWNYWEWGEGLLKRNIWYHRITPVSTFSFFLWGRCLLETFDNSLKVTNSKMKFMVLLRKMSASWTLYWLILTD